MSNVNTATVKALLFDIGEVVTIEQWHMFDGVEHRLGRTIVGRGPLDPAGDPVWQRYLAGELSFTGYWAEFAIANGFEDWRALFRELPLGPDNFVHPEAERLIRDAQLAGLKIGALTNDGVGINGRAFFESIPTIVSFDAFCDAQAYGGKPAAGAYLNAASELGVDPAEVIFLDDTPYCIDGARAVGMWAVLVDPMARRTGFDAARRLAGIGDVGEAQRLVDRVAAAYRSDDPAALVALLDPDVSVHLDGERVALGRSDAVPQLPLGSPDRAWLRSASGDTLTVAFGDRAVETWTLRRGLVIEIRRYGAGG